MPLIIGMSWPIIRTDLTIYSPCLTIEARPISILLGNYQFWSQVVEISLKRPRSITMEVITTSENLC
jgi:hypothetical protein